MATTETEVAVDAHTAEAAQQAVKARSKKRKSVIDQMLGLLSSVRFGVTMLVILLTCCIIGMVIMQVNVEGFEEYFQRLTPAQRQIYGALGFFDIYRNGAPLFASPIRLLDPIWPAHLNYFQIFLAITGLNIVLASIDRFPAAWQYVWKPKLNASPNFIKAQMFNAEEHVREAPRLLAERVRDAWRQRGLKTRISEDNNRITVFGQRNVWNRLGAYSVHVALLTIFTGGFLTSQRGSGGQMEIRPGMKPSNSFTTMNMSLDGPEVTKGTVPFDIECTDLQQKLVRPEGGLDAGNTIDWLSFIRIKDGANVVDQIVHLNNVGDYRGYRFFQSAFQPTGYAREITVRFEPVAGGEAREVTILRDGSKDVPGIGLVKYAEFYPDFDISEGRPSSASGEYVRPVARLEITGADGKPKTAFAFNLQIADEYYTKADEQTSKAGGENPLLVNGNRVLLKSFEKVALGHILQIQYDPGRRPFYVGSALLILSLMGVFLFNHQRVWAVIEEDGGGSKVHFGGNVNRNKPAFEGRFNTLVQSVIGGRSQQ